MKGPLLVTGSAGLLGSHLAELLRRRGLDAALSRRDCGRWACDLRDPAAARRLLSRVKPGTIFHLSGTSRSLPWQELWQSHVLTTLNLLEAARSLAPGAVIVISGSSAEYGSPGPGPVHERHPCAPLGPYGSSKLSQTLLALSYAPTDLDVRVARIFNAVGPGSPANLAVGSFARQIARIERGRQNPIIEVGDLSAARDFIDARDIASALLGIAARGRSGQIYNVASGRACTVRSVLNALLDLSTKKVTLRQAAPATNSRGLRRICGDSSKLRAEIGWKPKVPLNRSLRDTLESWRRAP